MIEPRRETPLDLVTGSQKTKLGSSPVTEITGLGFLNLRVKPDDVARFEALAEAAGLATALAAPLAVNIFASAVDQSLFWLGPDERLLVLPHASLAKVESALTHSTAVPSAVTDVSSGYTIIGLAAQFADEIVRSSCPYDVAKLTGNRCAQTLLGKAQVLLWKLDASRYRILVRRSYAGYCYQRLTDAARQWAS